MAYLLTDLKRLRKKYNLSQKDLAAETGVSQSLIAKIEADKVEPSYSKALKLFETLEHHEIKNEIKAKEIMTKKVITVPKQEAVPLIIKLMKRHQVSQIPVTDHGHVCGLITEGSLLEKTIRYSGKINNLTAQDIMIEVPPMVPSTTGLKTLLELLHSASSVLVMEKGMLRGIISKSDLLGKV